MARRDLPWVLYAATAGCLAVLGACGTDTGEACTESDLIAQCPAGTQPLLEASSTEQCAGAAEGGLIQQGASVTAACRGEGACRVFCQFANPCQCGVDTITRDGVVCTKCVGGCGDGSCDPGETSESCPIDCGERCTPGQERCDGSQRQVCVDTGVFEALDCPTDTVCAEDTTTGRTVCEGCNPELLYKYYPDVDEDTYGDGSQPFLLSCASVEGYVFDDTDCDDTTASVNPGKPDLCGDGVDNDCSGVVDDPKPTWYRDDDGDTYGDDTAPTLTQCNDPGAGYASRGNDCDDAKLEVNPDAQDLCDNLNNDCDSSFNEDAAGSCPAGNNEVGICITDEVARTGQCIVQCGESYKDCDNNPANGCETDLSSPATCRSCGHSCPAGEACMLNGCEFDIVGLSAGGDFTCALRGSGEVLCWGEDDFGQLGSGGSGHVSNHRAAPVVGITDAISIAAGLRHGCAALATGSVVCWGDNANAQLGATGVTESSTPVAVAGVEDVVAVTSTALHTCALKSNGQVLCWGSNRDGQLGGGTTSVSEASPVVVQQGASAIVFRSVSAGGSHTCAVSDQGLLYCWGDNTQGQLGLGDFGATFTEPRQVLAMSEVEQVAAGMTHTCATTAGGQIHCFGSNSEGEVGDDSIAERRSPVPAHGITNAIAATAGKAFSLGLLADGTLRVWGDVDVARGMNPYVGSGYRVPGPVLNSTRVITVDAGDRHACAALESGDVVCYDVSIRGVNTTASGWVHSLPSVMQYPTYFQSVEAGSAHTCAIDADLQTVCWGYGVHYQVGGLTNSTGVGVPYQVSSSTGNPLAASALVSAGGFHSCGVDADEGVRCWGANNTHQLGQGASAGLASGNGIRPTNMTGNAFIDIAAGGHDAALAGSAFAAPGHSCAVRSNGVVACWGNNASGQLGFTTTGDTGTPTNISTTFLSNATKVVLGRSHSLALISNGTVESWGLNDARQLGRTTLPLVGQPAAEPHPASLGANPGLAVDVAAGANHGCVAFDSGSVRCWGTNSFGEVGDGTNSARTSAVAVVDITDAEAVAAGAAHSCALHADGTVSCWGDGSYGQLGGPTSSLVPVGIPDLDNAIEITAAGHHTCVLTEEREIACWGRDSWAQLGRPRLVQGLRAR